MILLQFFLEGKTKVISCFVNIDSMAIVTLQVRKWCCVPMIESGSLLCSLGLKGDDKCREDCRNQFKGVVIRDSSTAPLVPKQCLCV